MKRVININADVEDATHYNHTLALVGDVRRTLSRLESRPSNSARKESLPWLAACDGQKAAWQSFKQQRVDHPVLLDDYWGLPVLTQPAAIKVATDWAKSGRVCFLMPATCRPTAFRSLRMSNPDKPLPETGASYMGFAVSALLATGLASKPFFSLALTGDGSFTMNPQILIDGAEHGARGCILLLDNGRMGAITSLQYDQYGQGFATGNTVHVDYLAWAGALPGVLALDGGHTPGRLAAALEQAGKHPGLSLIHVPVYFGPDPLGGMGVRALERRPLV